ncbi:uncharacterized protein EI90DRAFT_2905250 [Cantharellus anzutake]|uniref:uncharacterized protein n=1 Tax=Cantharellus anzutake TaxID=1750568 RepID=UPI001908B678|nr:uncharacterized protein EI90DRAFT_2905250 [Cantharellus anzutake]KAF8341249.1 hypothetical protein EI90DRAFT_2905250 [Cantharellus anzutake]
MPIHVDGTLDSPVADVDKQCRLLGPTALVVQALMGVIVIASLLYKRHRERPRRAWNIWVFDVSKQVVGQAILHGSNVLISMIEGSHALKNPCVTYFLNILLDTTIGVGLIYTLIHFFTFILETKFKIEGITSGVYGNPPSVKWWAKQAAIYVVVLAIMKSGMGAISLISWLNHFGKWLLGWSKDKTALQVIFVMGVFPITMNVLQFWLIDSIVKFKGLTNRGESEDDEAAREPLYTDDTSDPERDTDENSFKPDIESTHSQHRLNSDLSRSPDGAAIRPSLDLSPPTPTSPASSRTIRAHQIRRRSPPPSPSISSTPSSPSHGSLVSDEPDSHFGDPSRVGEQGDIPRALSGDGENSLNPTSPTDGRVVPVKWESWKMTSPPPSSKT